MTALQILAAQARTYFEQREDTWHTVDERPAWIIDLCRGAHGEMFPDNWRYSFIVEALDMLEENEVADDIYPEADVYTSELTAWLASRNDRYAYCEETIEEMRGVPSERPLVLALLQWGQVAEKREVLCAVRSFLEVRIGE